MYWFVLKRITPVVSAALVEMGSLICRPGVAPEIMVSLMVGARFAGVEPSQFVKLILTGMVLLYLNTLLCQDPETWGGLAEAIKSVEG